MVHPNPVANCEASLNFSSVISTPFFQSSRSPCPGGTWRLMLRLLVNHLPTKKQKVKRLKLDMKWHSKMKTHLNFNH
jgi:hypothetical protein